MKTPGFTGKPGVFLELVTWLEQATFSLRGLALAVFICVFLLLLLEKSCILRNFIWKLKRKVTIKFYQFLSFSKFGRQRVDIFLGVLLNYKAAFPCTCEFMYTGMFFSTDCTKSNFCANNSNSKIFPFVEIFFHPICSQFPADENERNSLAYFPSAPSYHIEVFSLINILFIFEKTKFFKLFFSY